MKLYLQLEDYIGGELKGVSQVISMDEYNRLTQEQSQYLKTIVDSLQWQLHKAAPTKENK